MPESHRRGRFATSFALLGAIALFPVAAQAQQRFDVRGVVVDTAHTAIAGAMVVALTRVDSVIAVFSTSTGSGNFRLKNLDPGDYILQVTRIGYSPVRRDFSVVDADVTADTVVMTKAAVELDALVINAEHIPIVNKPDTLEYNAAAFKTRINATVEELLKRLPGIVVGSDGTITAQGETVKQVLVDGKEFFGKDPKMATRNLPAAAVDKVQVLDKKSDNAEFTGIDDGERQKTMNLVLKPEARVGYFGRVQGGIGPAPHTDADFAGSKADEARYSGALNLNRFSPSTQLSLIGNRNNVGSSGFSLEAPVLVGRGGGGGGGGGFSETMAIGVNANHQFAEQSWLRMSYYLGTSDNRGHGDTDEQLLQGESVTANRTESATNLSDNLSHRLNLNAQHQFNKWNRLRFRGDFSAGNNNSDNSSVQETRTLEGAFQNRASSLVSTEGDNLSGDGRLTYSRRFNDAGASLVAEAWANLSKPTQTSDLRSSTEVFEGDSSSTRDLIQSQRRHSRTLTTGQQLSVLEPLGKGAVLKLYGEHRAISENQHYDVADIRAGVPVPNDLLSRAFDRTYTYLNGGTNLSRNTAALRWVVGLEVQNSDLEGKIINRDESISNGFTNLLPSANLRYQFNQGSNFYVNYRTSTRDPSITELQPFVDNTDPLRTYTGNPDLTPAYQHNLSTSFRRFDQFSFQSIYLHANLGYARNQIVQSRDIDAEGRQSVMPVNMGDSWSARIGGSYGTPIRALGLQVDLDYSLSRSTGSELINQVENNNTTTNHSVGITVRNRSRERLDLMAGAEWNFNSVKYSINDALDRNYLNSNYFANATVYLTEALSVGTNANYQVYDQNLFGRRDNPFMLGASVGMQMLDNRAEFTLAGVDLLNQNSGISISSSSSSITRRRSATLGRRIMAQFSYRLGSSMQGRRGGRRR